MQHKSGSPTWAKLVKNDVGSANAGVVTVAAGLTTIVDSVQLTVAANDIILTSCTVSGTKGGTAGLVFFEVVGIGGTGAIQFANNQASAWDRNPSVPANAVMEWSRSYFFRASVGGTVTVRVRGTSAGSDFVVGIDNAQLRATVIRGS